MIRQRCRDTDKWKEEKGKLEITKVRVKDEKKLEDEENENKMNQTRLGAKDHKNWNTDKTEKKKINTWHIKLRDNKGKGEKRSGDKNNVITRTELIKKKTVKNENFFTLKDTNLQERIKKMN